MLTYDMVQEWQSQLEVMEQQLADAVAAEETTERNEALSAVRNFQRALDDLESNV